MRAETDPQKKRPLPIVCVVDPDVGLLQRLTELITPLGAEVRAYSSGAGLLDAFEPGTACVVSEVRLPDMTGIELIRRLRERAPRLPVILLTSDGEVSVAVAAMRAGALDFIEKPNFDRLLSWRLRHLLTDDELDPARP